MQSMYDKNSVSVFATEKDRLRLRVRDLSALGGVLDQRCIECSFNSLSVRWLVPSDTVAWSAE